MHPLHILYIFFTYICTQENCDTQQVAAQLQQLQPILAVEGTVQNPTACHIIAEGIPVIKGHLRNCVSLLIASFFG